MFPTQFTGASFTWERKKLGILITRVKSYPLSRSVEVKKETDVKYVHYGDIHTNIADEIDKNNNLPFINEIYKEYDELKLDDVIVADASEDYKGIADAAVIISNLPYTIIAGLHTIALRPMSLIKGYFLYHIFKTENFKRFGYKIGTGLKVFGISYNNLAKYKVYYPREIEEQEKIIGILSNLTNSINLHERKCEELTLIKKALLQKLFPKKEEVRPEVRYKNFSDAWEQRKLGEVVNFLDTLRKPLEGAKRVKGPYPYYGASGIVDYVDGYLFDEELILLSEDGANITERNYPVCFLASGKYWVNNHAHVLKIKEDNDNNFICNSLERKDYTKYNTGMAMPKLNKETCKGIPIMCPNYDEQKKIGNYFRKFDTLIALHQRKLEKLKQLKKFLLQNMFI
ncbi:MAG: restriction endonuclease subunit S [Lactobacillus sp.]|nr:restriction endonuclease subunit S [Lactobacillus sp.]